MQEGKRNVQIVTNFQLIYSNPFGRPECLGSILNGDFPFATLSRPAPKLTHLLRHQAQELLLLSNILDIGVRW
jgi:hypothetical protein